MKASMTLGESVVIPDGRIGLLCERIAEKYLVRVRHATSTNNQFLYFTAGELKTAKSSAAIAPPEISRRREKRS